MGWVLAAISIGTFSVREVDEETHPGVADIIITRIVLYRHRIIDRSYHFFHILFAHFSCLVWCLFCVEGFVVEGGRRVTKEHVKLQVEICEQQL